MEYEKIIVNPGDLSIDCTSNCNHNNGKDEHELDYGKDEHELDYGKDEHELDS